MQRFTGSINPTDESRQRHWRTLLTEAARRYNNLSRRIAALDTDIGRELDSERRLVLDARRGDLIAERDQLQTEIAGLEQKLAFCDGSTSPSMTGAGATSAEQRDSLARQLADLRGALLLIEERKSQYVLETDVPLQVIKDERRLREQIASLEELQEHL